MQEEIMNKVSQSGLVNFDLSEIRPEGERIGVDLKDFLYEEFALIENEFREKLSSLDVEEFKDKYVYIYCSNDAIIPIWAGLLLASKLMLEARKVVFGNETDLEIVLMQEAIDNYNFELLKDKKILINGCSKYNISENAYIHLLSKIRSIAQSIMFGEACSSVPIYKNK